MTTCDRTNRICYYRPFEI